MFKTLFAGLLVFCLSISVCAGMDECVEQGFSFTIAKWEWNGEVFTLSDDGEYPGYTTSVSGNAQNASWTCSPPAAGVLRKSGTNTTILPGGSSGTIYGYPTTNPQGKEIVKDISHVTLCGDTVHEAPEYPSAAIPAVAVLAVLGVMAIRNKK